MQIEPIPKVFCLRYKGINQGCNPAKCTALKLNRLNLLKLINKIEGKRKKALVLDPFCKHQITIEDRNIILENGLIVIDCSWNKLAALKHGEWQNPRKLPPLIAVNPTNYGKWEKLSSAEAVAAALFISGFKNFSHLILSKFSWGQDFFQLNDLL